MNRRISRRQFVQSGVTAALAASVFPNVVPCSVFGAEAPSKRINVGVIGSGPRARDVLGGFLMLGDVRVLQVCDVKTDQLELGRKMVNAAYKNEDCGTTKDFRELLARQDIDAVLVGTPDHWHVAVGVAAARAGKDMYVEKPMGLSLAEDQLLRREVTKHKRVFQFGTQQRSSRPFIDACELVRNGRIGKLKQINVWCLASRPGGATSPAPVPAGLDYERWLGPARFTPYTEHKCSDKDEKTWWFNSDYALGFIAGWGVHPLDIALWGYPEMMSGPIQVSGKGVYPTEGACNTAVAWQVNFALPHGVKLDYRGARNGFTETLPMNGLAEFERKYNKITSHGTAFEGSDGWILVDRTGMRTSSDFAPLTANEERLPRSSHHVRNFIEAIKTRGTTVCPIDEAVKADTLCHLSDIAARLQRKLTWDPANEKFTSDKEANKKLELRPMRKPWQIT